MSNSGIAYPLSILYTNHRGETRWRMIVPQRIWVGQTQWHPQPQWLLTALDCESGTVKDFSFGNIESIVDPQIDKGMVHRQSQRAMEEFGKWVSSGAAQSPPLEIFKGPILTERQEKEFRDFKEAVKDPANRESPIIVSRPVDSQGNPIEFQKLEEVMEEIAKQFPEGPSPKGKPTCEVCHGEGKVVFVFNEDNRKLEIKSPKKFPYQPVKPCPKCTEKKNG